MFISERVLRRAGGIALVDLIAGIVIISIAVAGVTAAISLATQHSADPLMEKQALAIAEAVLEEVELLPFTHTCTASQQLDPATNTCVASATRSRASATAPFDNVFDYNGFSLPSSSTDLGGVVTVPTGYSASVSVITESLGGVADAARITVTVSYPNGSLVLEGYRTKDPVS